MASRSCIFLAMGSSFEPRGLSGLGRIELGRASAHVWLASSDLEREPDVSMRASLSDAESARAQAMAAIPRRQFIGARAALRRILAAYLEAAPDRLEFTYGRHGKPSLGGAFKGSGLRFNLSHSSGSVLVALAQSEVGIDLERIRPLRDADALAARFFAPSERQALQALPARARRQAFFAYWTAKEACVKAMGEPLAPTLSRFEVALAAGRRPEVRALAEPPRLDCELRSLVPQPGFAGAIAVRGPLGALRCWRLAPAPPES